MVSPKELERLAKMCRKAGIKSFKSPEFEFTLTDEAPQKTTKAAIKASNAQYNNPDKDFETDTLTEDQLLMWSAAPAGVPFAGDQEDAR